MDKFTHELKALIDYYSHGDNRHVDSHYVAMQLKNLAALQEKPNEEPIGYLWIMHDGSRNVMWSPIDPQEAFYSEPSIGSYKEFIRLYDRPRPRIK